MEKSKKGKNPNPKKGKSLIKLIKPDSDSDDSEHELSYYVDDRVQLMKEVLKILNPKKIKSMAPKWMRNLETEEINSMLFEELLGISNKRLKCILNGQKLEEDSSSTDPEEDQKKPIDVISLDDVSDDDFVINLDSDDNSKHKHKRDKVKVKEECKRKKLKREKRDRSPKKPKHSDTEKEKSDEQNLMSVLELLELQARARAIRSQLALESKRKAELKEKADKNEVRESDNEDAVIIESPKNIEIVITSSESENEDPKKSDKAESSKENGEHRRNNEQSIVEHEETVNKSISDDNIEERLSNSEKKSRNNQSSDTTAGKSRSKKVHLISNTLLTKDDKQSKDVPSNPKEATTDDAEPGTSKMEDKIEKRRNKRFRRSRSSTEGSSEDENVKSIVDYKCNKGENVKAGTSKSNDEENLLEMVTSSEETVMSDSKSDKSKCEGKTTKEKEKIFRKRQESSENDTDKTEINFNNESNCSYEKSGEEGLDLKSVATNSMETIVIDDFTEEEIERKKNRIYMKVKLKRRKANSKNGNEKTETSPKNKDGEVDRGTSEVNQENTSVTIIKTEKSNADLQRKNSMAEENDGLVINVDQSEMDCITLG